MKDCDQPTVLVSGVLMHAGDRVWTTVYRNLSVKDPQAIYAERICGVIRDDLQTALFGNLLVPLSRCSFVEPGDG